MASGASPQLQMRLKSSFIGDRLLRCSTSRHQPLPQLFRYNPGSSFSPTFFFFQFFFFILQLTLFVFCIFVTGTKHVSMQLSRTLSGLTNLFFNRRYLRVHVFYKKKWCLRCNMQFILSKDFIPWYRGGYFKALRHCYFVFQLLLLFTVEFFLKKNTIQKLMLVNWDWTLE